MPLSELEDIAVDVAIVELLDKVALDAKVVRESEVVREFEGKAVLADTGDVGVDVTKSELLYLR